MKIARVTPVLFVDRVEATRDFFTKVGFTVLFDVPEGDHLGFVGLEKDGAQVMVETRGNANEGQALRETTRQSRGAVVFVEVDNLDAVIAALASEPALVERHKTFYGADEISFMEPGGNVVTFARFDR
ncbi:MAG TPA: VOC family protein [Usitatibacter sp.]|nr:VOC family protein [Usitatibacter sp.]